MAVVAALLLVRLHAAFRSTPDRRFPFNSSESAISYSGEALLHRIRPDSPNPTFISFHLPFLSLTTAALFTHDGGLLRSKSAHGLLLLAIAGLLVALTYSLAAPVVFALFLDQKRYLFDYDYTQTAFSFLVLLTAGVLLWRARKPSARKSLVLGLAIGSTLLFRSSLAFFPPVLALYEWLFLYRRSLRLYWTHFTCLCVVPYLFLIPWIRMNWLLYRRFVPFEYVEANCNIVTGALGLVQTIQGDWRALINRRLVNGRWNGNVFSWALRQIALHPLRYSAAYIARVVYVVFLNPIPLLLALGALWVYRDRNEFKQLGLLVLYFIGIHCFMSVQPNYFMPLWPLAAILAGALIDRFRPRQALRIAPRLYRLSRNIAGACVAAVLALALMTDMVVDSYARRFERDPRTPESVLDGDILSAPNDAWLLLERGRRRLKRGDVPAAAADLSKGLALAPDEDAELKLAWAKMLLGEPRPLLDWRPPADAPPHNRESINGPILKAHAFSRMGQTARARQELQAAMEAMRSGIYGRGHTALELETIEELRRDSLLDERLLMTLRALLPHRPAKEMRDLLADLAAMRPESLRIGFERAALAARAADGK